MPYTPEGSHLAYVVRTEAKWWQQLAAANSPIERQPGIDIMASLKGNGGGVRWEFAIVDREIPEAPGALFVEVDSDSWAAFRHLAGFFQALADGTVQTLDEVRAYLDTMGAADETTR